MPPIGYKIPEMVDNTAVAILGGHAEDLREEFDFEVCELGYVNDTQKIVDVYNACDVFVLPSCQRTSLIRLWRQWHVVYLR